MNNNNTSNNHHSNNELNTFKDYIRLIKHNLIPVLVISVTVFVTALIYALYSPDIYKSTTVLKIAKPKGDILSAPLIPEFQDFGGDRFIANEIEILKSYRLREMAAISLIDSFRVTNTNNKNKFKLIVEENHGDNNSKVLTKEEIIGLLDNVISIEQKRGLDIVEITAESESGYEAALFVNCYAEAYKKLNLEHNRQQVTMIKDFLAEQRQEKMYQLATIEETVKAYQEQKGIVQLPEQAKALIEQTTDLETKMNTTKIELTISEKTLNEYKAELARKDPDINDYIESFATEPYIKNLQMQIADLKTQKDRIVASSSDGQRKNDIIKEFDAKIDDLKNKLYNQLSVYRAGVLAASPTEIKELTRKILEEEVKYESLSASFKLLNKIVQDYDLRINKLPTSYVDLARLTREQTGYEKLYLQLEEKYQEAVISEQSVPGNVLIIDAGLIPYSPAKPNRKLLIAIGLIAGISLGFIFAFVRTYFDNTVKSPEDIQNKNLSVIGWIPLIEGTKTDSNLEFIVARKPDAIASEAFRAVRTRVKFSSADKGNIKTILITSSVPQEGKTTTAVNLAATFAIANYRTLIIDADLRKPRVNDFFNQKRQPGFVDYFYGQAAYQDIFKKTGMNNLYFITCGNIPLNPSEILGSNQMETFITKLKDQFEYIIIDSPPLLAATDSEILAEIVDASILVISANKTDKDIMEKSVEILKRDRSSFLGVLLNRFNYLNGYSAYYKSYYSYSQAKNNSNSTKY